MGQSVDLTNPPSSAFKADQGDAAQVTGLVADVAASFSYVANAGWGEFASAETTSEDLFGKTFAINVKGEVFGVQKALPLLVEGASSTSTPLCRVNRPAGFQRLCRQQGGGPVDGPYLIGLSEEAAHPGQYGQLRLFDALP